MKLIPTDYCMPDMTGYDLLMEVKVEFFHKLKKLFVFIVPHIVSLTYVMLNFVPNISKYWKTLFINKICLIHSRNHLS